MSQTDKEEMQLYNETLAQLMQKAREEKAGGNPAVLKAILKDMEDQMQKQRFAHQREIDKLRRQIEDAERAKNAAESEQEAQQRQVAGYQIRCQEEAQKCQQLQDQLERANKKMQELEQEANAARAGARGAQEKQQQMQGDIGKAMEKYDNANNELNKERAKCKELQSQLNQLLQKNDFSRRSYDEQNKENQARLDNAKRMLADMEQENKALRAKNDQMPAALEEARRRMQEEMKNYREQAEYNNNKNMKDLQKQSNALSGLVDKLKDENSKLQKENDDLNTWRKAMEARAAEQQSQKESLEAALQAERNKNNANQKDADKRLKEMNELLVTKTQENNSTRDAMMGLREEITQYGTLLGMQEGGFGAGTGGLRGGSSSFTGLRRSYSGTGGRTGGFGATGSAGSQGSGRNRLGTGQGGSRRMKLPANFNTEYSDNYTKKSFTTQGAWGSKRCALPRVE